MLAQLWFALRYDVIALWVIQLGAAGMQAFKAMMRRETTLIQRTLFVYIFKAVQVSSTHAQRLHTLSVMVEDIASSYVRYQEHICLLSVG